MKRLKEISQNLKRLLYFYLNRRPMVYLPNSHRKKKEEKRIARYSILAKILKNKKSLKVDFSF